MSFSTFCQSAPLDYPVFMQDWYLDAVCEGGQWKTAWVEHDKRIIGVWPIFSKQKFGKSYVVMPPLCRQMGPYLLPQYRGTEKENGLIQALLEQMPAFASFEQDFNYTAQNWLPLYWRGYHQTTRYSYRIDVGDISQVWNNIKPDYRNNKIKKAQRLVQVQTEGSLESFLEVHNKSFSRQGLEAPVSDALLQKLDAALIQNKAGQKFFAVDRESGKVHAVAYLIWDRQTAWYLMSGDDPALRNSGAGILLAWHAIRYTHEVLRLPFFDFAGSMLQPVEHVRRHFGAVQQQYFRVWKDNHWLWRLKRM